MIIASTCKFCHVPINLDVDDEWLQSKDDNYGPDKLLPFACCDRCADFRNKRYPIFDRIKKHSMLLFSGAVSKDDKPKTREILIELLRRYMRLYADFRRLPVPDWDEVIIDDLMAKPGNFALILTQIPKMFRQPTLI